MTDIKALWDLSYGVYTLCVYDKVNSRTSGCIVNTLFQVTSEPAVMAVSISKDNHTHTLIQHRGSFVVSILSEQTNPFVISALGFSSGVNQDKLAKIDLLQTPSGAMTPKDNICAWMEFEIIGQLDLGTHTLFTAMLTDAKKLSDFVPMTYRYYHQIIKGKAPKNAPTYMSPK